MGVGDFSLLMIVFLVSNKEDLLYLLLLVIIGDATGLR